MPRELVLTAQLGIRAAGSGRRFSILAYSGGLMKIGGWDRPIAVDLSAMQSPVTVPIVIDHEITTDATIGQTDKITNNGRTLVLAGPVTGSSQRVQNVLNAHDAGQTWQASIGLEVQEYADLEAGQTAIVNGRQIAGPAYIATRYRFRETSVLPVGADSSTKVNLAAVAALKGKTMPSFDEWLATLGIDPAKLSDTDRTALMTAYSALPNSDTPAPAAAGAVMNLQASRDLEAGESLRVAKIRQICIGQGMLEAKAIRDGWTVDKTELEVLRASSRPHAPSPFRRSEPGNMDEILEASLCLGAGVGSKVMRGSFSEQTLNVATTKPFRDASFHTLFERVILAAGQQPNSRRMNDVTIRQAFECNRYLQASGFSTISLPGTLSNIANKTLLSAFSEVPMQWTKFCSKTSAADFKQMSGYRVTMLGSLDVVGAGGEIKHIGGFDEQTYTNQIATRAKMLAIPRQLLVNDDLQAFSKATIALGRMGAIALEKNAFTTLLSGITSGFFATGNGNYFDGSPGSLLSVAGLTTANEMFLRFEDENGDPVMLVPSNLIVGTTLSTTADKTLSDIFAADTADVNPFSKKFTKVASPFIDNQSLTNATSTGWFLSADPATGIAPVEMAFLDGVETPTVQTAEADFNVLGVEMRVYFDFGSSLQEPKSIVFAKGAAA